MDITPEQIGLFIGGVVSGAGAVAGVTRKITEALRRRRTDPAIVEEAPADLQHAIQKAVGKADPALIQIIGTLSTRIAASDDAYSTLEHDLGNALDRLSSVEKIATGQRRKIQDLEEIQMRHTSEIERLQSELEQTRAALAQAQEELQVALAQRDAEKARADEAEAKVVELSARVAQLEARIAELEQAAGKGGG